MAIAITDDHKALAETAAEFLRSKNARGAARGLLEAETEELPSFWKALTELGWQGLHIPEEHGGSGYGIEELVVVVEQLGRQVTPGPFVPSAIASATLVLAGDDATKAQWLPGLASGSVFGAAALGGDVTVSGGKASGSAVVLGGGFAHVLVLGVGDDVAVVEVGDGVSVEIPANLDTTRRSARVTLDGAPATVLAGAGATLRDVYRTILAAEAVGLAHEATQMGAQYAKERLQFGRVIGTYQAVKHHCANMFVAAEMATAAVWDAARATASGGDQLAFAAATAATLAAPAADLCANLNTQVHGGIAITWEHDAHLYMRRATTLLHFLDAPGAGEDLVELTRRGVTRAKAVELPPEAEPFREEVRAFIASLEGKSWEEQRTAFIETGYVMPHWPKPYGRDAGAVEQLVIQEEFGNANVKRPQYGITAWNILTIIQHGNQDQLDRWVLPALNEEVVWCQLFSEPDAGSDAAGVKTKATRVDGGWLVNGQKVWTSGAHYSGMGFATVRTNPDVPKHDGITMMAIDMHAEGVEVRPLKMTTGNSEFNEVFFNDVFVPDDDVVGPVDGGWTVARATLGNESVSIGGGMGGMSMPANTFIGLHDANPGRLVGGAARIGRYIAGNAANTLLNLRSANRAVAGGGPGPEGAMTKLLLSELGHESVAIMTELIDSESVFMDGNGGMSNMMMLMHRGMSIAGGTSEIKRNQIGERILGLPRDPLIS
jgi:alkylation response protein AidB-like acyl-CoA dehydrogenase